ncbi:DUF4349 domain-containing protein [Pseudoflavitalea sp. X16]|uniref:DUF4349 domain-containing protein n=1 Tax=Paraflavitalea devenefica TaxID=2716334 RepID=UPI0014228BE2|nr:DUF4349 domain-containing protein [Paraflavitalea devenefica]NII26861.1 DUF4349 domain-containing protein [Paraflavitalea devenefica]
MKYNHQWQLPLCAVLLLTFNACNYNEGKSTEAANTPAADVTLAKMEETPGNGVVADSVAGAPAPPQDNGQEQQQQRQQQPQQGTVQQSPAPNPDWDKKIIKNATLSVEVKDYTRFNELVRAAVKQSGGYIAQEEQNESDYKIENAVTIKVPVDQFDNAVAALTPGKEKVLIRKITSQDVTGEVVDTRSRLEAKRQVRLRYLDLLKQAKNMEEILQVQNEINDLQEHMEAAAGRINYLSHAAAFSTIQLSYFQVLNPQAKDISTPPGFGKKVLLALGAGLEWVGELIILLLTLWPVWIALLTGWWLFRRYRPAKRIIAAPPAPPAEQSAS